MLRRWSIKVDLHRHLGGSINANSVYEILCEQGKKASLDHIKRQMTFSDTDKYGFHEFLGKFKILDDVHWTEKAIRISLLQVYWDILKENISYAELKYSVDKYLKYMKVSPKEVVNIIYDSLNAECQRWGTVVAPVLSLKYESDREDQRKIAKIIEDPDVISKVVGIDLVGDEEYFDDQFYAPILKEWKKAGKGLEAHVGETRSADNVRRAIEVLEVDRIAHGILASPHLDILEMARERGICFDIAITSNMCTGVIMDFSEHPVRQIIDAGCDVTIGTDDPFVLQTTLDDEYSILLNHLGFSESEILDLMNNSVKHAFVDLKHV